MVDDSSAASSGRRLSAVPTSGDVGTALSRRPVISGLPSPGYRTPARWDVGGPANATYHLPTMLLVFSAPCAEIITGNPVHSAKYASPCPSAH